MWITLAPIIAKYGIEFGYKLWSLIKDNGEPTEEQWTELRKLASKTADQYLAEAEAAAATRKAKSR